MSQKFFESNNPSKVSEFFAHATEIEKFSGWLDNFANKIPDTCKACLIFGDVGVGKTTLARVVLNEKRYTVIEYSATEFRGSKQLKETLDHIIDQNNVSKALRSDCAGNQKMAIMIDNVEGISLVEKNGLSELIFAINPLRGKRSVKKVQREQIANRWTVPIICISSEPGDKRSIELKKDCFVIEIPGWTARERFEFVKMICSKYKWDMKDDDINSIIDVCGVDTRKMLHVLFEALGNVELGLFVADYKIASSKSDICGGTHKILCEDLDLSDALVLYNRHRMLLPLMIHENYTKILESIDDDDTKFVAALRIMDGITLSDQIDNFVYDSQNWNLPPYSAVAGVLLPNVILKNCVKRENRCDSHSLIKFTSNLSKTSLQYTNIKIINSFVYRTLRPTFSWDDLITLTQVYDDLKNKEPIAAQHLLASYNFSDDMILKIKKADKIMISENDWANDPNNVV